jgi:hypothetical protein
MWLARTLERIGNAGAYSWWGDWQTRRSCTIVFFQLPIAMLQPNVSDRNPIEFVGVQG